MTDDKTVKLIFDRIEENKAIFLVHNVEYSLPMKSLPKKIEKGDVIYASLFSEKEYLTDKASLAKELLNEILGNND